jgi:hypothetical protein
MSLVILSTEKANNAAELRDSKRNSNFLMRPHWGAKYAWGCPRQPHERLRTTTLRPTRNEGKNHRQSVQRRVQPNTD